MKLDYIIVGLGLAGLAFAEQLIKANKSFIVFEDSSQTSSLVAGGVYNPVILKRFTPVWNAKQQLELALPFYESLEEKFQTTFDYKFQTKKVFKSIEDQNNWFTALDNPKLVEFLEPNLDHEQKQGVISSFGFGNVKQTGRIDTKKLVDTYRAYLEKRDMIRFEQFKHQQIKFHPNHVQYQDIDSSTIVFCEGFGMRENIFFNYLPLNEVKGELITIHAPNLKIDFQLKSTLFVLPLGEDNYKVGATFNWSDKTSKPSKEGREELIEKLNKVIDVPYTILSQTAGIRPTIKDRRPLVGRQPAFPNLAILNGLGTRGVMIAPTMADALFNYLEKGKELDPEINIKRFE
ncbi:NAD(P)/FAD-dependent oxidoreductase [Polaribacter sp. P097]|uniref:NAD(P)/FAD-dependent oxidoreductase n=1 Tax=Polaribacter sp. P097 TaxID=3117398 RepID=UPI002FE14847